MHAEEIREICLSKKGVSEGFPFDSETLVFKVGGKMFCLIGLEKAEFVNLKCDPEYAVKLREQYEQVKPGWHMSKKHWNSVMLKQNLSEKLIHELIQHSYDLVFASLSKSKQAEIEANG